ncbi:MAG: aminotransferase class [Rhodospirillales bacterium]|nr:aminotransferase class [Rhodospirillales bacterium]
MDSLATIAEVADAPWDHGGPWYHGGNLNAARRLFPNAPEPWLDLSTGINPVPYPIGDIAQSAWARLPEPSDIAALEAVARTAYGADQAPDIVPAPGTQAIIQWLPRLFPARRVAILGLTYGEHEQSWRAAGAEVVAARTLADLGGCDAGVIVNPNNPDGRTVAPAELAAIAEILAARGGLLVVDEAFMDVIRPGASLIPILPKTGAIVLRSFGKTYGLAGLRLGFAVASPNIGARLRSALGPWAISGPAIQVGRRALADKAWLTGTVQRLNEDKRRLDTLIVRAGFTVAGGTPLFRFAECAAAGIWFDRLGRAGILTRPFPARPSALRFGIPCNQSAWERLETALQSGPALL